MSIETTKGIQHKYSIVFKSVARIIFGLIWLTDAFFKFQPAFAQSLPDLIKQGADSQPSWMNFWFDFWINITSSNAQFFAYTIAFTELGLAFCLLFGFARKLGYLVGILTSLIIWSVPEGFGGPYGQGSTDIGTGIIYAMVFLLFIVINDLEGPSKLSIDYYIETKYAWWRKVAEFS